MLRIEAFPDAAWPLPIDTLHWAYLISGLLIAAHYGPLLVRAWRHLEATATAQSLATWAVWTACRLVAFTYGIFVLHDLVFLIVVGADVLGRLAMAALIVRARLYVRLKQQILAGRSADHCARFLLLPLALAVSACNMSPASPPRLITSGQAGAPARASASLFPADHHRFAAHALLANLLDDADPPRFQDPQWHMTCGEASRVQVDGEPVEQGAVVPARAFTLSFDLQGACPLGAGGPLLTGRLEILVVRDDEHGMVPVVLTR